MRSNILKKNLYTGGKALGLFATVDSVELIEIAGLCGFDFVVIDCEHGSFSVESTRKLIMAAELRNIVPMVRITEKSPSTVLRTLDVGAYGLLVPDVTSKEEASEIVKSAKYFPLGTRGMAMPRSGDYGLMEEDYHTFANENTLIAVQCESLLGLEHLDGIVSVPGVDVVFIGPFDLSQSLGVPGQVEHPLVQDATAGALRTILAAGKIPGVFAVDAGQAKRFFEMGFQFVIVRQDIDYFVSGCKQTLSEIRSNG